MAYYHLGELIHQQALNLKHRTALKYQSPEGEWIDLSWQAFSNLTMKAARAMADT